MRRFIVGLLATIGTVTVLSITGVVVFLTTGPLSSKRLPDSMVLSLDLRRVPSESSSTGCLAAICGTTARTSSRPSSCCGRPPTIRG
jgi:protease-4